MTDLASLSDYISFKLADLNAKNMHHAFEDLCHQFARRAISVNFLPATGPVSAGGDQGRDSETFRTTAVRVPPVGTPWSFSDGRLAVIACSLEKRYKAKIEKDITAICSKGEKPASIYFFSNQNIPVATRHTLERDCKSNFGVDLTIFDLRALGEQLTNAELFWIAEKFLGVPSEMYPRPTAGEDTNYTQRRRKWLVDRRSPQSHADFMDIKYAMRHAIFTTNAVVDISGWIEAMRNFAGMSQPNVLSRRAQYEICVVGLRGLHDLTPYTDLVIQYFADIDDLTTAQDLIDAVALLSYSSSAVLGGEFQFDTRRLYVWTKALIAQIEKQLKVAPGPNAKCELLQCRATAAILPFQRSHEPPTKLDAPFKWWDRLVREVEHAPLFALDSFANELTALVAFIGDDPRFTALTDKVSVLLDKRTSGFAAAEKCRDRAIAYLEANRPISAIRELHTAKTKWFAKETLRGTALTMLLLSQVYGDLKLIWAAKYYALATATLIQKANDDELQSLLPGALIAYANLCYQGGEWLNFIDVLPLAAATHYQFRKEPENSGKHDDFQGLIFHAMILCAMAQKFPDCGAAAYLVQTLQKWPLPDGWGDFITNPPPETIQWIEARSASEIWTRLDADLDGPPFADAGTSRGYTWRALGIQWKVQCDNTDSTTAIVEGLISCLQIVIADIADVELILLPTTVSIEVTVASCRRIEIEEVSGNDSTGWRVRLPNEGSSDDVGRNALTLATTILSQCSLLPYEKVMEILNHAFGQGLQGKAFTVSPYHELVRGLKPDDQITQRNQCSGITPPSPESCLHEVPALAWRGGPGPGYSRKESLIQIKNRYANTLNCLHFTLPRLAKSETFRKWVDALRADGYFDWHILSVIANVMINYRIPEPQYSNSAAVAEYERKLKALMLGKELSDTPEIPVTKVVNDTDLQLNVQLVTVAQTWGLVSKARTPNVKALKTVLAQRYGYTSDDINHTDVFDWPAAQNSNLP